MARAGPHRKACDLPRGISGADTKGRRPIHAGCFPKGPRVLRYYHTGLGRVCGTARAVWSEGTARSHGGASSASARLFLSLDVRSAGVIAASNGNDPVAGWTSDCNLLLDCAAALRRHGGEELAPSACCSAVRVARHYLTCG